MMKNPRFYKLLSVWAALGLSICWFFILVTVNGLFLLESMLYLLAVIFTFGIVLLLFPSLVEDHDQSMMDFFHTGFGIAGSMLAIVIILFASIMITIKQDGPRLKWLLVVGALLQLIVFDLFSVLTAAFYVLAAFLPNRGKEPLEETAAKSVH